MLVKGVNHKAIPATISKLHEIILASLLSTPAADIILEASIEPPTTSNDTPRLCAPGTKQSTCA